MKKVATGLASGATATPDLAAQAVTNAMEKAGIETPSSVLLFLSSEFAADPQSAIKAAAKAASCTQVVGCSASGIFTEEDWILDSPAAAAMVFSDGISMSVARDDTDAPLLLTLAAPSAINSTWLEKPGLRFGGVSGDATGHGPFSVWQNGKGATQGYCDLVINNTQAVVAASHGLKSISSPQKVKKVSHHDVLTIGNMEAVASLNEAWGKQQKVDEPLPYHQLTAIYANKKTQLAHGEYNVASIVTHSEKNGSVTLSKNLNEGDWFSWAIRDVNTAQIDIVKTASELRLQLKTDPSFAILFSCLGRGPYFYDGSDQDLELLKTLFPKLPIIGFYGNGEIVPISGKNEMLQYSAVLGLFAENSKK